MTQAATSGSPTYMLGVNPGPHDPAAALIRDGELVAMVEQERLSRHRHAIGESPRDAIVACLAHAGIGLDAVAEIAIGWDVPVLHEIQGTPFDEQAFRERLIGGLEAPGMAAPPLRYVGHHLAHAASAFYTSGMEDAAILIADGRAESVSTTIATAGPNGIDVIDSWGTELSLGHFYGCAAAWAGLGVWGAGKLMGLAGYGVPCQPVPLRPTEAGYAIAGAPPEDTPTSSHFRQLGEGLLKHFREHNFPFAPGCPPDAMAHANFAASIQHALEAAVLSLASRLRRESGLSRLALAGGVALNCAANGTLIRAGLFDEIWIPPVPHDAGVALGAALIADRDAHGRRQPSERLPHALWGPEDPSTNLPGDLSGCEANRYGSDQELADQIARRLQEGDIVGWWRGRAEIGPRALGARSILCDARSRSALVRTNAVKGREAWRPFAPAVLSEHSDALFDGSFPDVAQFMLTSWPVRNEARGRIPAALHVDGSTRPQLVAPGGSAYRNVLEAFNDRTGVPALVNTSFNLAGEPMVFSADDALRTFLRSDIDVLVLDDLVVQKPARRRTESTAERSAQIQAEVATPMRLGRQGFSSRV